MKINYFFAILFLPLSLFAQRNEIDTLLLDKMIVANIDIKVPVGTKINSDCSLADEHYYVSPHSEVPNMTYVTDYVLCNNGKPEIFFEVYNGKEFVYVKDAHITFNKDADRDNIKVTLSRRTVDEKAFLHANIQQIVDFGTRYFVEEKEQEMSAERKEAMLPFFEVEKYGIGFIKYNATEGYSSTGAHFEIFNPSKKAIKYIWFTFAGENAVEDLVKMKNGTYYTTVKGIGPIESYGIGSWSFEYVWFTDIIQYLRLSTIKIQYMDGSLKTVKYNKDMYIGEDAYYQLEKVLNEKDKYVEEKRKNELYIDTNKIYTDTNKIYTEVEQLVEFPGGINKFRSSISNNFDTGAMDGDEGVVKTTITFVVERDGSITDVKADGPNRDFNAEAIRSVKSVKNKWFPAKINGQAVRYQYRLPFTMSF